MRSLFWSLVLTTVGVLALTPADAQARWFRGRTTYAPAYSYGNVWYPSTSIYYAPSYAYNYTMPSPAYTYGTWYAQPVYPSGYWYSPTVYSYGRYPVPS